MVLIRGKNNNSCPLVVNTALEEWCNLHPNNIRDFRIDYGLLHTCKEQYPGGMLPGMTKKDDELQTATIKRFDNLIEWTKLLEEDVKNYDGKMFLRSKFFERREKAWKSPLFLRRNGNIMGYYIDSCFLHKDDKELMENILFFCAYKDLISKLSSYQKILKHLETGGSVDLQCNNIDYSLTPKFNFEDTLGKILLEDLSISLKL